MNTHISLKFSAITLLVATTFSPLSSLADQSKIPVINISGPAIISEPTNTYKFKEKKISFTLGLQEIISDMPACPSRFGGTTTGIGRASDLGVVTLAAEDCITPIPMQNPMHNYFSSKGKFTLTTVNGDNIIANYSGSFIPTNYPLIYSYENFTIQITGGTGRFAGATGSGILEGTSHIQTGLGEAEGTLLMSYGD